MSSVGNVPSVAQQTQPVSPNSQATNVKNNATTESTAQNSGASTTQVAEDQYVGSVPEVKTGNYSKNTVNVDMNKINEMKADMKNNVGAFKVMAEGIAKQNGVKDFAFPTDDASWSKWVSDVVSGQFKVSESQSAEATEAIGEDGYWGVEKTSQRIVDFAKEISGGDIEQYDKLIGAIEKGFGGAKDAWGKKMPDITSQTYDKVMEKMKAWKDEATGTPSQKAATASEGILGS